MWGRLRGCGNFCGFSRQYVLLSRYYITMVYFMNALDMSVFRFATFTLDTARGRLLDEAGDVALRPKSFALLCYLARNAGRVMSKDELIAVVWPGVTVTDDSLTQCIRDLRKTLGVQGATLVRTIPRRGYVFDMPLRDPSSAAVARPMAPPPAHPGSIAVMPFTCLLRQDQVLCDGLVNDVIGQLARLRSFHVIARGSTFALRHMAVDPIRAGSALGVAYVVTGTVTPRCTAVCLQVDLVRTDGGAIVWTDDIVIARTDILGGIGALADRIAHRVAREITSQERMLAVSAPDHGLDAWQSYHRGLDHVFRFDAAAMALAQGCFASAIAQDAGFARAHAGQSFCHYFFAFAGLCDDRDAEIRAALHAAQRAMDVDDGNPSSQWAFGRALWLAGDSDGGLLHTRQAVALCPGFAHAHYMIGFIEAHHGDPQRALDQMAKTEALSPFDPFLASVQITRAVALLRLGDIETAAIWARKASHHSNAYSQLLGNAALILAAAGQRDEARGIVATVHKSQPQYRLSTMFRSIYSMPDDVQAIYRRSAADINL